jgi:hypothetical protein
MDIEQIKEHLAKYKREILNISQNGMWKKNNKQYEHILPEELKEFNIIKSDYYKLIIADFEENNIKLHSDFHHLNSSQALCFNLFYPLIFENKLITLFNKINKNIGTNEFVKKYEFEYIENNIENTNFDLFIETNKNNYYFEIKYTENEFGQAKNDIKHRKKYNDVYKERLHIFKNVSMEVFFKYYQILRNLIYNNGYNIFVFPSYRNDLKNIIDMVLKNYCTQEQRKHINILYIEDIAKQLLECDNTKLQNHYNLFMDKYFIKK